MQRRAHVFGLELREHLHGHASDGDVRVLDALEHDGQAALHAELGAATDDADALLPRQRAVTRADLRQSGVDHRRVRARERAQGCFQHRPAHPGRLLARALAGERCPHIDRDSPQFLCDFRTLADGRADRLPGRAPHARRAVTHRDGEVRDRSAVRELSETDQGLARHARVDVLARALQEERDVARADERAQPAHAGDALLRKRRGAVLDEQVARRVRLAALEREERGGDDFGRSLADDMRGESFVERERALLLRAPAAERRGRLDAHARIAVAQAVEDAPAQLGPVELADGLEGARPDQRIRVALVLVECHEQERVGRARVAPDAQREGRARSHIRLAVAQQLEQRARHLRALLGKRQASQRRDRALANLGIGTARESDELSVPIRPRIFERRDALERARLLGGRRDGGAGGAEQQAGETRELHGPSVASGPRARSMCWRPECERARPGRSRRGRVPSRACATTGRW